MSRRLQRLRQRGGEGVEIGLPTHGDPDAAVLRRNGRLEPVTWDDAFRAIAEKMRGLDGSRFAAIAGDLAAAEEMFALKALSEQLGSPNIDCRQDGAKLDPGHGRASYLFNATIEGIDRADAILLIGTNPRHEAPVLNARILKRWRQSQGHVPIGLIGTQADLTYPYEHLGGGPEAVLDVPGDEDPAVERTPEDVLGEGAHGLGVVRLAPVAVDARMAGAAQLRARPLGNGVSGGRGGRLLLGGPEHEDEDRDEQRGKSEPGHASGPPSRRRSGACAPSRAARRART